MCILHLLDFPRSTRFHTVVENLHDNVFQIEHTEHREIGQATIGNQKSKQWIIYSKQWIIISKQSEIEQCIIGTIEQWILLSLITMSSDYIFKVHYWQGLQFPINR